MTNCIRYQCKLSYHKSSITSLAYGEHAGNSYLVSGSADGSIVCWDWKSDQSNGSFKKSYKIHTKSITGLAIGTQYLVSASLEGKICITTLDYTGSDEDETITHYNPEPILAMALSEDKRIIGITTDNKKFKLYNTLGICKYSTPIPANSTAIRFTPVKNNHHFALGSFDGVVHAINDVLNVVGDSTVFPERHVGQINSVAISPDGAILMSVGKDQKMKLHNYNSGALLDSFPVGAAIFDGVFSPICYWSCLATDNGIVIFNLESKVKSVFSQPYESKAFTTLLWDPSGLTLFAGMADGAIQVWSFSQVQ